MAVGTRVPACRRAVRMSTDVDMKRKLLYDSGMPPYAPTDERVLFRKDKKESSEEVAVGGNENNPGSGNGGGWRMDEDWLLQYARRFAASHGYEIDESFASAFLDQVRTRNVEEDDRHSEAEAIAAVKKIVTAAIEHSPGTTILTADSFRIGLSDLCPLWPFCR
jgi:hypothetical protein